MPALTLVARVDVDEVDEDQSSEQTFLVRSPAVGVADGIPAEGVYLNPTEGFLTMRIMGRRHVLQLPRKVQGRVTARYIEDTRTPVAYNQPLLRLSPFREDIHEGAGGSGGAAVAGAADAELIPVESPSEGIFYRRPSPDSPLYVDIGSRVTVGSVVGLVEVMKCFNQIRYGGPGLPEQGTVAKALVEDAAEVTFGQVLFLIRPA